MPGIPEPRQSPESQLSPQLAPQLSRTEFVRKCATGPVPPLYMELPHTDPSFVFESFRGAGSILLESVKGPYSIARYSFVCFEPFGHYRIKDGIEDLSFPSGRAPELKGKALATLRALLSMYSQAPQPGLPPFQGGAAGLFSYDFVKYLERVPQETTDDLDIPDADIYFYDRLIAFDHKQGKTWAIAAPGARLQDTADWGSIYDDSATELARIANKASRSSDISPAGEQKAKKSVRIEHDVSRDDYTGMVRRAKQYIAAGDIFQANLSLRVSADIAGTDPWELYRTLKQINPTPISGYLEMGDYTIASSSPERLVRVNGRTIETRPIAGTRPRVGDAEKDDRMREELLLNEKERAEHIMLIDLERNDMGRVCDYGSVHVDELMTTEDYSHVIHIVSNITGTLADGKDMFDAIAASFPGGTITGVPKVRCMEIINELESLRRGPYTGAFGYMGYSGNMDLNIIIRTFTVKGGKAYVQAGAGIVADSDPEREYRESLRKAEALIKALERCPA